MPLYIYLYIYVHIIHINCTKHCIDICVHFGHLFSFSITYIDLRPFFSFSLSRSLAITETRVTPRPSVDARPSQREPFRENSISNHVFFRLFKDRFMTFYLKYFTHPVLYPRSSRHRTGFCWHPSLVTVDCALVEAKLRITKPEIQSSS